MSKDLFFSLPLILIAIGGVIIMIFSAKKLLKVSYYIYMSAGILIVAEIIQLSNITNAYSFEIYPSIFNGALIADTFSSYFNSILILGAILTILLGNHYFQIHKKYTGEFFSILLFSVFGMMLLIQANDLITAFIALEISSISVYIMIGFYTNYEKRIEASYKYLVLGSVVGAIFLLGIALIFAQTQSTDLGFIKEYIHANFNSNISLIYIGATLMLVTFLFKIAAFPFQSWAIDVYDGAALPVTGFMAAALKIAIFGFMLRLMLVTFNPIKYIWNDFIVFVIIATLVYGTFLAVIQTSIKRMLAASSIVHTGYILISFISADTISEYATGAIIFYQVAYFLSAAGAFGLISYIASDDELRITYNDFKGFALIHPFMAACMSVFMISLAGIPSTIGFIGKFYIFSGAIQANNALLSIAGISATFISLYYYLKLIAVMYFYPSASLKGVYAFRGITASIIIIMALAVVWGGVGNVIVSFAPDIDFIIDLSKVAYNSLFLK